MPIFIDISDIGDEFSLTKEDTLDMIDFVVKEVTATFARNWSLMAEKNLHGTREEYIRSLYVGDEGRYTGFVQLRGSLPNMIESGSPPFDLKPSMLSSAKAHQKKGGGVYFTVPFRWATHGSIGDSSVFSAVLPMAVYNIAKNLSPQITTLGGKGVGGVGLKMSDLPKEFQIPKVRASIIESKVFEEYKHKTSIYVGIGKSEKTYGKGKGGSYMSFRRISDKSDPMSWIHRGFQAKALAEAALSVMDIGAEADRSADGFLKQMGF